jgi:hypothetical protein
MRGWLAILGVAAALALAFTLFDSYLPRSGRSADVEAFERLMGGLGMGASCAIYWDFSTFDPRLEPDCTCSLWPVPGGYLFSPEHRMTVFDPPELLSPSQDTGDSLRTMSEYPAACSGNEWRE